MPARTQLPSPAAEDRRKWNDRYRDSAGADAIKPPAPHPLAIKWRSRFAGGPMLDAACGLGRGIAGAVRDFEPIYAVDVSDEAIGMARRLWPDRSLRWIVGDVTALPWPQDFFGLVCSLRFTDRAFLRSIRTSIRPGGMFLYEGFSERQLARKPDMNPGWVMTQAGLAELFADWEILEIGESTESHPLIHCAAIRRERM